MLVETYIPAIASKIVTPCPRALQDFTIRCFLFCDDHFVNVKTVTDKTAGQSLLLLQSFVTRLVPAIVNDNIIISSNKYVLLF